MTRSSSTGWRAAAALALTVFVVACGGDDTPMTPTSTTNTTNTNNTSTPSGAYSFRDLAPRGTAFVDYTTSRSGTLQIVADWGASTNDIDVFVTRTSCTAASYDDLFGAIGNCASMASASGLSKPERVEYAAAAGTYRIYVASSFLSERTESGNINISLR